MDLGIRDRVALVAASSKGLGKATAMTLSQEGAKVVICARNNQSLQQTASDIHTVSGNEPLVVLADLSTAEGCQRVVQQAVEHFGTLHILVTNNGGPPGGDFFDFDDQDWQAAVNLTLMSTVRLIRASVPTMRKEKWGRIINIASASVKEPLDGLLLSNSLRPGVIGMARSLANELAQDGITVNNVLPGPFATDRMSELTEARASREGKTPEEILAGYTVPIPVGRIGQPDELAALVAFLASEHAAFINGTSIIVDGGRYKGLM